MKFGTRVKNKEMCNQNIANKKEKRKKKKKRKEMDPDIIKRVRNVNLQNT